MDDTDSIPADDELCDLTAVELRRMLGERVVSAREVLAAHLARVERIDPAVNAIVTRTFDAAEDAARAADELAASGADLPTLHGLPTAHKDLLDTAGVRTTWGSTIFADHVPETEEYGVASFVYRARRPFEPEKIMALLNGDLPGVIRAKGHFWIATRPEWVAEFSLAGALSSVKQIGTWWASVPKERWPEHVAAADYITEHWCEPWGDRRQELGFIGAGIDWPTLKARLDACMVPLVAAPGPDALPLDMPDPFPGWRRVEDAA